MARLTSTTVRLEEADVQVLKRARAGGLSASDLIRKGLRVVASRYFEGSSRLGCRHNDPAARFEQLLAWATAETQRNLAELLTLPDHGPTGPILAKAA